MSNAKKVCRSCYAEKDKEKHSGGCIYRKKYKRETPPRRKAWILWEESVENTYASFPPLGAIRIQPALVPAAGYVSQPPNALVKWWRRLMGFLGI